MTLFCILRVNEDDPNIAHSAVQHMILSLSIQDRKTIEMNPIPGASGPGTLRDTWFMEPEEYLMVPKSSLRLFNPEHDTVFATKEVSKQFLTFFEKYGRSVKE